MRLCISGSGARVVASLREQPRENSQRDKKTDRPDTRVCCISRVMPPVIFRPLSGVSNNFALRKRPFTGILGTVRSGAIKQRTEPSRVEYFYRTHTHACEESRGIFSETRYIAAIFARAVARRAPPRTGGSRNARSAALLVGDRSTTSAWRSTPGRISMLMPQWPNKAEFSAAV